MKWNFCQKTRATYRVLCVDLVYGIKFFTHLLMIFGRFFQDREPHPAVIGLTFRAGQYWSISKACRRLTFKGKFSWLKEINNSRSTAGRKNWPITDFKNLILDRSALINVKKNTLLLSNSNNAWNKISIKFRKGLCKNFVCCKRKIIWFRRAKINTPTLGIF